MTAPTPFVPDARTSAILAAAQSSLQETLPSASLTFLGPSDHAEVASLFTASYLTTEPTTLSILANATSDDDKARVVAGLEAEHSWAAAQLLHNGPCIGVRDGDDEGKLLAFVLAEDYRFLSEAKPLSPPPTPPTPNPFAPLSELLGGLKNQYHAEWLKLRKRTLWIADLSVHPDAQNSGLGTRLVRCVMDVAAVGDAFEEAMAEATGISQECFAKCGMREVAASIDYQQFSFENQHPFRDIARMWSSNRFAVPAARLMVGPVGEHGA
ncbi:hypothetical protein DFJ77DRAFT_452062 [Powellomyces hirtus]|nr:hypothetical protein DFJ77DRAFT_452062 [Powellomyces hirtus]